MSLLLSQPFTLTNLGRPGVCGLDSCSAVVLCIEEEVPLFPVPGNSVVRHCDPKRRHRFEREEWNGCIGFRRGIGETALRKGRFYEVPQPNGFMMTSLASHLHHLT